jgi:phosphoenolpyruvate-protein kinase (PTS system EI component)
MRSSIKGMSASSGIAVGPAWVYKPVQVSTERKLVEDPTCEWTHFEKAISLEVGNRSSTSA